MPPSVPLFRRQEPEPPGDPTRCLFLPRSAIRALVELGGSNDTILTLSVRSSALRNASVSWGPTYRFVPASPTPAIASWRTRRLR